MAFYFEVFNSGMVTRRGSSMGNHPSRTNLCPHRYLALGELVRDRGALDQASSNL